MLPQAQRTSARPQSASYKDTDTDPHTHTHTHPPTLEHTYGLCPAAKQLRHRSEASHQPAKPFQHDAGARLQPAVQAAAAARGGMEQGRVGVPGAPSAAWEAVVPWAWHLGRAGQLQPSAQVQAQGEGVPCLQREAQSRTTRYVSPALGAVGLGAGVHAMMPEQPAPDWLQMLAVGAVGGQVAEEQHSRWTGAVCGGGCASRRPWGCCSPQPQASHKQRAQSRKAVSTKKGRASMLADTT